MTSRTAAWIELDAAWKSVDNLKYEINKFQLKVDEAERNIKQTRKPIFHQKAVSIADENVPQKPAEVSFRRATKRKVTRNVSQPSFATTDQTNSKTENKHDLDYIPTKQTVVAKIDDRETSTRISQNEPVISMSPELDADEFRPQTLNDERALLDLVESKSTPFFTTRLHSAILKSKSNGMQSLQLLIENQKKGLINEEAVHILPSPTLSPQRTPVRSPLEELPLQDEQLHHAISRKTARARNLTEYRGFALQGNLPAVWITPNRRKRNHQQKKSAKTPQFRPKQKKIAKIRHNDAIISTSSWKEGRKLILKKLRDENKVSISAKTETELSVLPEEPSNNDEKEEQEDIDKRLTDLFAIKKRKKEVAVTHSDVATSPKKSYDVDVVRGFMKKKRIERKKMLKEEDDWQSNLMSKKKQSLRNLDEFCKRRFGKQPVPSNNKYEASKQLWGEKFVRLNENEKNELEPESDVPGSAENVDEVDVTPSIEVQKESTVSRKDKVKDHRSDGKLKNGPAHERKSNGDSKSSHLQKLQSYAKEIEAVIETEADHIQKLVNKSTEIEEEFLSNGSSKSVRQHGSVREDEAKISKVQSSSDMIVETNPKELAVDSTVSAYDPFNFISALSRKQMDIRNSRAGGDFCDSNIVREDSKRIDNLFEFLLGNRPAANQDVNEHVSAWLRDINHLTNERGKTEKMQEATNDSNSHGSVPQNVAQSKSLSSKTSKTSGRTLLNENLSGSSSISLRKKDSSTINSNRHSSRKTASSSVNSVLEKFEEVSSLSKSGKTGTSDRLFDEKREVKNGTSSLSSSTLNFSAMLDSVANKSVSSYSLKSKETSQVLTESSVKTVSSQSKLSKSSRESLSSKTTSSHSKEKLSGESDGTVSKGGHSQTTTTGSTITENYSSHSGTSISHSVKQSSGSSGSNKKSHKRRSKGIAKASDKSENRPSTSKTSVLSRQIQNELSCLDFLSDQLLCVSELNAVHAAQMSSISRQRFQDIAGQESLEQRDQENSYQDVLENIRQKHQHALYKTVVDAKSFISHAATSILHEETTKSSETYASDFDPSSSVHSVKEEISASISASIVPELENTLQELSSVSEKLRSEISDAKESVITANLGKTDPLSSSSELPLNANGVLVTSSDGSSNKVKVKEATDDDFQSELKQLMLERWKAKVAREKVKIAGLNLIKKKLQQEGDEERARMILKTEKRIIKKLKEDRDAIKSISTDTSRSKSSKSSLEICSKIEDLVSSGLRDYIPDAKTLKDHRALKSVSTEASHSKASKNENSVEISTNIEEVSSSINENSIPETISTSTRSTVDENLPSVVESTNISVVTDSLSQVITANSQKSSGTITSKNASSVKSNRSRRGSLSLRLRSHPFMQDSSVSDESVNANMSHTEATSDFTDLEVRVYALKEELRHRKSVAERLKSELKKKHRERLKKKEESLKKQIEAYDHFIQQTTEELNREIEASASQSISVVKPKIRQPHFEHRHDGTSSSSLQSLEHQHSTYEDTFTGSKTTDVVLNEKQCSTYEETFTGTGSKMNEVEVPRVTKPHEKLSRLSSKLSIPVVYSYTSLSEAVTEGSVKSELPVQSEIDSSDQYTSVPSEEVSSFLSGELSTSNSVLQEQEHSLHDSRSLDKTNESLHSDVSVPAETVLSLREEEDVSVVASLGESTSIDSFTSSVAAEHEDSAAKRESIAEQIASVICSNEIKESLDLIQKITTAHEYALQPSVSGCEAVGLQSDNRERIVDGIVQSFVNELVNSSVSCMADIRRRKQLEEADEDKENEVSKKVTSIMACLNEKRTVPKNRPQDLMMISSVENESDWFAERTSVNVIQVPETLQIEEPEWFDDDIGLGLPLQMHKEQQQAQPFPSYYYRKIPDKPPPPYSPVRAAAEIEKPLEPAWSVPRTVPEVGEFVCAAAGHLFDVLSLMSLKNAVPSAMYLAAKSSTSEAETANQRAFHHFLFDLAKEIALEVFSDGETEEEPWIKLKRLTKKPPIPANLEHFVATLQGKMHQNLNYLMGHYPTGCGNKFGNKQRERVGLIVLEDMQREEERWIDYDFDEVAVKFQIAEDTFQFLLREVVTPLQKTS